MAYKNYKTPEKSMSIKQNIESCLKITFMRKEDSAPGDVSAIIEVDARSYKLKEPSSQDGYQA